MSFRFQNCCYHGGWSKQLTEGSGTLDLIRFPQAAWLSWRICRKSPCVYFRCFIGSLILVASFPAMTSGKFEAETRFTSSFIYRIISQILLNFLVSFLSILTSWSSMPSMFYAFVSFSGEKSSLTRKILRLVIVKPKKITRLLWWNSLFFRESCEAPLCLCVSLLHGRANQANYFTIGLRFVPFISNSPTMRSSWLTMCCLESSVNCSRLVLDICSSEVLQCRWEYLCYVLAKMIWNVFENHWILYLCLVKFRFALKRYLPLTNGQIGPIC